MDLIRDEVCLRQNVLEKNKQIVVRGDFLIPDVKPDIGKILHVTPFIEIEDKDVMAGKIMISGKVIYKVVYSSNGSDLSIRSVDFSSEFKEWIEDNAINQDLQIRVLSNIENVSAKILNERKIALETIFTLKILGFNVCNSLLLVDDNDENIEKRINSQKICEYVSQKCEILNLSKQREIEEGKPSIFEILNNDVSIECTNSFEDEGLIVKGNVYISTLYVSEEDMCNIERVNNQIPFSITVDNICEDDIFNIETNLKSFSCNILEDVMGANRVIGYDIDIDVCVNCYRNKNVDMVTDIYSTNGNLKVDKDSISYEKVNNRLKDNVNVEANVTVPDIDVNNIDLLCDVPMILESKVENNNLFLAGVIGIDIVFVGDVIMSDKVEIPFSKNIELHNQDKSNIRFDIVASAKDISFNKVSDSEISIKGDIKFKIDVIGIENLDIIKNLDLESLEEGNENLPNMVIYLAKENDDVWNVAKRFKVKKDDVMVQNNLETEKLTCNQKIILVK